MFFVIVDISLILASVVSLSVMHRSLGRYAIDSLAAVGLMDPKMGLPLLLAVLFYTKIFYSNQSTSHEIVVSCSHVHNAGFENQIIQTES